MKTYVGIDLGACDIKAAKISAQTNRVQPVKLNTNIAGGRVLPCAVYYDKINGEVEIKIGESAEINVDDENKITRLTPKLASKSWSKYIPNVGRKIFAVAALKDVLAKIWKHIAAQSAKTENCDVTIVVPAAFSNLQKKLIRHAAINADVPVSTILTAPFASLFACDDLLDNENAQTVLIFDFGGTALDVTIFEVERTEKSFNVTSLAAGSLAYGGVDIDESIFRNIFMTKYKVEVDKFLADDDGKNKFELMSLLEKMKEEIFLDEEESSVGSLIDGGGNLYEFELTRTEIFTALDIDDVKSKITALIDEVLDDAGILPDEITLVKLFGGTSAVDCFVDALREYFGENVVDAYNLEREDLPLGAAVGAVKFRKLTDEENLRVKVKNVVPCGIYMKRGEKFFRCIKRNELGGFATPYKPLMIYDLIESKWRLSIYQSFANEMELPAESEELVFIGDVQLDSALYTSTQAILYKMLVKDGKVTMKFFEDVDEQIIFVEEKILSLGDKIV